MNETQRLDLLVAERVMGWAQRIDFGYKPPQYEWHEAAGFKALVNHPEQLPQLHVWSPSTDIRAAWEVVEKLDALGWFVSVDRLFDGRQDRFWRVDLCKVDDADGETYGDTWGDGATAPLAVCIAALKAVEAEVPA